MPNKWLTNYNLSVQKRNLPRRAKLFVRIKTYFLSRKIFLLAIGS